MTEADWLSCSDPPTMLVFQHRKVTDRKLRLYACACVRLVHQTCPQEVTAEELLAVEVTERFVDGISTDAETAMFQRKVYDRHVNGYITIDARPTAVASIWGIATAIKVGSKACRVADRDARYEAFDRGFRSALATHCDLIREIFGNPFRPIAVNPRWFTSTVIDLARTIYDDRVTDRMPILADALMDAGCDHEEILNHCRSNGQHVRGCRVVDLVLGKD